MTTKQQKGILIENRFIELLTLQSKGALTCYRPVADDDGIDLIINQRQKFKPIYVQIKSRFGLDGYSKFVQDVKECNTRIANNFYFVFICYSEITYDIEFIWIVPSVDFLKNKFKKITAEATAKRDAVYGYRFAAYPNAKSNNVKWVNYKVNKSDVGKWFLERI